MISFLFLSTQRPKKKRKYMRDLFQEMGSYSLVIIWKATFILNEDLAFKQQFIVSEFNLPIETKCYHSAKKNVITT